MKKQIHFYAYSEKVKYDNYFDTEYAIKHNFNYIDTNQMSFLSTLLFEAGYHVYIHEDEWFVYEIKLGDNRPFTNRIIKLQHNLFKLWKAGEFKNV